MFIKLHDLILIRLFNKTYKYLIYFIINILLLFVDDDKEQFMLTK